MRWNERPLSCRYRVVIVSLSTRYRVVAVSLPSRCRTCLLSAHWRVSDFVLVTSCWWLLVGDCVLGTECWRFLVYDRWYRIRVILYLYIIDDKIVKKWGIRVFFAKKFWQYKKTPYFCSRFRLMEWQRRLGRLPECVIEVAGRNASIAQLVEH